MTDVRELKVWDPVLTPEGSLGVIMSMETFEWTPDVRIEVWVQDTGQYAVFGNRQLEWVEGDRAAGLLDAYVEWRDAKS